MSHLITCPECRKQLQVPDDLLSKTVQCPECKHIFTAATPDADDSDAERTAAEPVASKEPEWDKRSKSGEPGEKKNRSDDGDDEDDVDTEMHRGKKVRPETGEVTAIGVMALVGGILGILLALGYAGGSVGVCCLWPEPHHGNHGDYARLCIARRGCFATDAPHGNRRHDDYQYHQRRCCELRSRHYHARILRR